MSAIIPTRPSALAARGLPGPCILVGHSLGAHYARIFAQRHPDDVVPLVLLDRRTRDQLDRMPDVAEQMQQMTAMLARAPQLARLWCLP